MNLSTVLQRIADLEKATASLYAFYADVFDYVPDARQLFLQLQKDENAHKNQAIFQKRIVDRSDDSFAEVDMDIRRVDYILDSIDSHISQGVFELNDALDFAIAMEESAAKLQYRRVISKELPGLAKATSFIEENDDSHLLRLREFRRKYEGRSSLMPNDDIN